MPSRAGRQLFGKRARLLGRAFGAAARTDRADGHSYPHDVTVAPAIGWLQEVLRWCDHWLKGKDTGIMGEPPAPVLDAGQRSAADLLP